jgi:hypothetical protein
MHLAWVKSKGKMRTCPICIDEQNDQHVPLDQRTEQPLPCPKHGDPRFCLPGVREAVEIYGHMNPGSHIIIEEPKGDKIIRKFFLNIPVCESLCHAYGVDFLDTLEKLEIIHHEVYQN